MARYLFACLVLLVSLALALSPLYGLAAEESSEKKQLESTTRQEHKPNPSGYLTMELGQGAFIFSALAGKGTLTFQGKSYTFKIGGAGIGGIGASLSSLEGEVYNLSTPEDFSGVYFQFEGSHAVFEGTGVFWLKNSNGVKLELRSKTKGLMMTAAGEGVVITMDNPKK